MFLNINRVYTASRLHVYAFEKEKTMKKLFNMYINIVIGLLNKHIDSCNVLAVYITKLFLSRNIWVKEQTICDSEFSRFPELQYEVCEEKWMKAMPVNFLKENSGLTNCKLTLNSVILIFICIFKLCELCVRIFSNYYTSRNVD